MKLIRFTVEYYDSDYLPGWALVDNEACEEYNIVQVFHSKAIAQDACHEVNAMHVQAVLNNRIEKELK